MTASAPTASAPLNQPVANARDRNVSTSAGSKYRSEARYTAASKAPTATVRPPSMADVGLSQLVIRLPAALPTGTRPEAIAPMPAPSVNADRIEEIANVTSTARRSIGAWAAPCSAYASPRKTRPSAARAIGIASVEATEPNTTGYAVQVTVSTKI